MEMSHSKLSPTGCMSHGQLPHTGCKLTIVPSGGTRDDRFEFASANASSLDVFIKMCSQRGLYARFCPVRTGRVVPKELCPSMGLRHFHETRGDGISGTEQEAVVFCGMYADLMLRHIGELFVEIRQNQGVIEEVNVVTLRHDTDIEPEFYRRFLEPRIRSRLADSPNKRRKLDSPSSSSSYSASDLPNESGKPTLLDMLDPNDISILGFLRPHEVVYISLTCKRSYDVNNLARALQSPVSTMDSNLAFMSEPCNHQSGWRRHANGLPEPDNSLENHYGWIRKDNSITECKGFADPEDPAVMPEIWFSSCCKFHAYLGDLINKQQTPYLHYVRENDRHFQGQLNNAMLDLRVRIARFLGYSVRATNALLVNFGHMIEQLVRIAEDVDKNKVVLPATDRGKIRFEKFREIDMRTPVVQTCSLDVDGTRCSYVCVKSRAGHRQTDAQGVMIWSSDLKAMLDLLSCPVDTAKIKTRLLQEHFQSKTRAPSDFIVFVPTRAKEDQERSFRAAEAFLFDHDFSDVKYCVWCSKALKPGAGVPHCNGPTCVGNSLRYLDYDPASF